MNSQLSLSLVRRCRRMACLPALALLAMALAMVAWPPGASAYPKPSLFPISWEFKFEHCLPRRIAVMVPGSTTPQAFWYVTFTLTNDTGQERNFIPAFDMLTNDGTVIHSDAGIPNAVFEAIKLREHNLPKLEPLSKIAGKLLQGEDQARDGVAIWAEPMPRMGSFSIFVSGLSGEACILKDGQETVIKDWSQETPENRAKLVILFKTLQLKYQIPGDDVHGGQDAVVDKGQEWIMR